MQKENESKKEKFFGFEKIFEFRNMSESSYKVFKFGGLRRGMKYYFSVALINPTGEVIFTDNTLNVKERVYIRAQAKLLA